MNTTKVSNILLGLIWSKLFAKVIKRITLNWQIKSEKDAIYLIDGLN